MSFLKCGNVRMSHVAIQFSNGTGLFIECVQEAMIIEYCVIRDSRVNVIPDKYGMSLIGGGIILLEDCKPQNANSHLIHESIIASNEFQYHTLPHYDKLLLCPEDSISIKHQHYNDNNNSRNTELQNQVNNEGLLHAHNQSRLVRPEYYDERHVRVRQDSENDALIVVTNKSSNYETLNN